LAGQETVVLAEVSLIALLTRQNFFHVSKLWNAASVPNPSKAPSIIIVEVSVEELWSILKAEIAPEKFDVLVVRKTIQDIFILQLRIRILAIVEQRDTARFDLKQPD
jgi:hypothetical protein